MSMTTELATGDPLSAPITAAPQEHGTAATRWSLPTRIIFRFCVLYFGLYILTTQMYWGFARIVPWVQMPYLRQNTYVQRSSTAKSVRAASGWKRRGSITTAGTW